MDVGDRDVAGGRQRLDLLADAVDKHHLDSQAAEDGDIDEQIAEVVVGDDGAVEGNDKRSAPETGARISEYRGDPWA